MQSMTGYGRARACRDGREITIELKTVNHRFLDLSFRMPKNLTFLEDVLRERINKSALKRGHVDVFVTYANTRADAREARATRISASSIRTIPLVPELHRVSTLASGRGLYRQWGISPRPETNFLAQSIAWQAQLVKRAS